jgi:hypothetical protein
MLYIFIFQVYPQENQLTDYHLDALSKESLFPYGMGYKNTSQRKYYLLLEKNCRIYNR